MCVCVDVNQGGTVQNRCTQRLVILHAHRTDLLMNPDFTPQIGQSELIYGLKLLAEKIRS